MEWFSGKAAFEAVERELDKHRDAPGGDSFVQIPKWQREAISFVPAIMARHLSQALQARAQHDDARFSLLIQRIEALEDKN